MSEDSVTKALLARYPHTFAEELGLDVKSNQPEPLYGLLNAALLFSARIGHNVALAGARALLKNGWTTPEKMLKATWAQRAKTLNKAGYARYDERTSTMLADTAQLLLDLYGGDLRKLRKQAGKDPEAERDLLKQFKGIGDVGASIFLREAQVAWKELYPYADKRVVNSARKLRLPTDGLSELVRGPQNFARLADALVRVQLERTQKEITSAAAPPRQAQTAKRRRPA